MKEPLRNQENTVRSNSSDLREEPQEEHLSQSGEAGCEDQVLLLINSWNIRTKGLEFREQEVGKLRLLQEVLLQVHVSSSSVDDDV